MDSYFQQPPPPSPAPPPHPQTRSGKAAMAFARFAQPFGIGTSRPPSSSGTGPQHAPHTAPRPTVRMASRTTELVLDSPIQAFSANQSNDRVIVAGRDFLRVINVVNDNLQESHSLRIPGGNRRSIQNEVKWGNNPMPDLIATAATNGSICIYKDGKQDRILHEHHRQVNRLAFNLADGRLLLSASQDGNIKLWDLRDKKSRCTFQGKAEAARDVQFNGANAVEFAAAFENGSIQRWDFRNPNSVERKISNAHQGPVYSVAWHPDGRHCASGGRDKTVKVWDFYADPRRKPKHTVHTQMSVARVVWRPMGLKTTELATCSISMDYRVHLWDLKRPYMPTYVLSEHTNAITGLHFKDEDILWSAGKDCAFVQHDIVYGHQPIADLPQAAFAWNCENEFTFAAQKRKRINKAGQLRVHLEDEFSLRVDDDKKRQGRSSSFRGPNKPASEVSALEKLMEKYQPTQATARVNLPIFNFDTFAFLAEHYVTTLQDKKGINIGKACMKNAKVSYLMGEFRMANTWRALSYILQREEEDRIEKKEREERERQRRAQELLASAGGGAIVARRLLGLGAAQYINPGATPLARAVPDTPKPTPMPTPVQMDNVIHIDEALLLPPAAFGTSVSSSTASTDGDSSPRHFPDDDYDLEELDQQVRPSSPRPILHLDTTQRNHPPPQQLQSPNHNSLSYGSSNTPFFSTSGEGDSSLSPGKQGGSTIGMGAMDDQPLQSPYEQPRTRPRQYSIGLVSEQTSSSYEDRVLGELQEGREDEIRSISGLESLRNNLHAIAEEREGMGMGTGVSKVGGYKSGGNLNYTNINRNNSTTASNIPKVEVNGHNLSSTSNLFYSNNNNTASTLQQHHLNPPQLSPSDDDFLEKPWSSINLIPQLLSYYTERGDVQFCTTLINLLHRPLPPSQNNKYNKINLLTSAPPEASSYASERQIDEWAEGYVDLLHRRRLLNVAAQVAKWTPSELVRQRRQTDTFIHTSCGWCEKPLVNGGGKLGWICESCKRKQDGCVVCRRGGGGTGWGGRGSRGSGSRWVMCQICGHGGHDGCLQDWFFGRERKVVGGSTASASGGSTTVRNSLGSASELPVSGEGPNHTLGGRPDYHHNYHNHYYSHNQSQQTQLQEDVEEDVDEEDYEPMETCPAVGCGHVCLPRAHDYEGSSSGLGTGGSGGIATMVHSVAQSTRG